MPEIKEHFEVWQMYFNKLFEVKICFKLCLECRSYLLYFNSRICKFCQHEEGWARWLNCIVGSFNCPSSPT